MVYEIIKQVCGLCKTEYDTKDEANACETDCQLVEPVLDGKRVMHIALKENGVVDGWHVANIYDKPYSEKIIVYHFRPDSTPNHLINIIACYLQPI